MNYRHAYHAGNFADVHKHVVLLALIESLKQKDKPFCYIDTHAGRGLYDLTATEAQKTDEAELGIKRLLQAKLNSSLLDDYLKLVLSCNQGDLQYYPGSPTFVRKLLREEDKMILSELHPEEYEVLRSLFYRDRQVAVHQEDAYVGLKAFLPPLPRRGLVLIDPPFEVTNEFSLIIKGLKEALRRWETGIYAIWYPIKNQREVLTFLEQLKALGKPILNTRIQPFADDYAFGLNAAGMAIINPPWQVDERLKEALKSLWTILSPQGHGYFTVE